VPACRTFGYLPMRWCIYRLPAFAFLFAALHLPDATLRLHLPPPLRSVPHPFRHTTAHPTPPAALHHYRCVPGSAYATYLPLQRHHCYTLTAPCLPLPHTFHTVLRACCLLVPTYAGLLPPHHHRATVAVTTYLHRHYYLPHHAAFLPRYRILLPLPLPTPAYRHMVQAPDADFITDRTVTWFYLQPLGRTTGYGCCHFRLTATPPACLRVPTCCHLPVALPLLPYRTATTCLACHPACSLVAYHCHLLPPATYHCTHPTPCLCHHIFHSTTPTAMLPGGTILFHTCGPRDYYCHHHAATARTHTHLPATLHRLCSPCHYLPLLPQLLPACTPPPACLWFTYLLPGPPPPPATGTTSACPAMPACILFTFYHCLPGFWVPATDRLACTRCTTLPFAKHLTRTPQPPPLLFLAAPGYLRFLPRYHRIPLVRSARYAHHTAPALPLYRLPATVPRCTPHSAHRRSTTPFAHRTTFRLQNRHTTFYRMPYLPFTLLLPTDTLLRLTPRVPTYPPV